MSTRAVCRPKPERMSCGVRSSAAVVHPKGELTRGPNTKSRPPLCVPTLIALRPPWITRVRGTRVSWYCCSWFVDVASLINERPAMFPPLAVGDVGFDSANRWDQAWKRKNKNVFWC